MSSSLPPWLWLTGCVLLGLLLCLILGLLCHDRWCKAMCRRRALLAELARVAERERLSCDVHDALLQGMQGILLSFQSVGQRFPAGSAERAAIEHLLDQGDAALADGRQRLQALRPPGNRGGSSAS